MVLKGLIQIQEIKHQNINCNASPDVTGYTYGLIMMDCSMPVMDGFDATIEIRQAHHQRGFDQPVIVACTGHCEPEFIEKAWLSKMDELVPKPLKQKVVAEILHELII